jgi:hypothetical protein
VIRPNVDALDSSRDHLPVVIREVCESADSSDVTGSENAWLRFEGRRVDLQPAAFCLRESGTLPCFGIGASSGRNEHSVGCDESSGLQVKSDGSVLT